MVYLFIDKNQIKLLYLKKTMLGQYETIFFEKKHEAQLINKGRVIGSDLLASAIKEALSLASSSPIKEKQIFLILPQEAFHFLRTDVPSDIAQPALASFIRDKARSLLPIDIDNCLSDCFVQEVGGQKTLTFYAMEKEVFASYQQVFSLIDLKLVAILPDNLAYFKLFEKTLRREKRENILYVYYEKSLISGYLFDSFGLIDPVRWLYSLNNDAKIEKVLKEKAQEMLEKKTKLNRIVLSGPESEAVRQDTFTKSVGVWTNPLKKIINTFYNDYLKLLVVPQNKQFPLMSFDVCFGSFIFHEENKNFSLLKNGYKTGRGKPFTLPSIALPKKELLMFIGSFILSFLFFLLISNSRLNLNFLTKSSIAPKSSPTLPPSPSPTPTPSIKKEDLKIKVLNGSGTAGKASNLKDILKNAGYQEILTGNADNFDFVTTEIDVKKARSEAADLLKNDLKNYVQTFKIGTLDDKEAADAVIIIGKDFK